jgi:hypothetical protein
MSLEDPEVGRRVYVFVARNRYRITAAIEIGIVQLF